MYCVVERPEVRLLKLRPVFRPTAALLVRCLSVRHASTPSGLPVRQRHPARADVLSRLSSRSRHLKCTTSLPTRIWSRSVPRKDEHYSELNGFSGLAPPFAAAARAATPS